MLALLGNSGSPRWYAGPDHDFDDYLDHLAQWGATSAEIVLHHGPYDDRTARVHVIDPDWASTIGAYQRRDIAVQLHVSLDRRFATSRWRIERDDLKTEFEPILALAASLAERQERIALVLHGAADSTASSNENDDSTVGLLDWLATRIELSSLPMNAALELGAAKQGRETASARSRASVLGIVQRVASEQVGICWDVAHDCENARNEPGWKVVPSAEFLRQVVHVHLHDLDGQNMAHYPLLIGRVPFAQQLEALHAVKSLPSLTMEIRWLCATRMGEPWSMLEQSYRAVKRALNDLCGGHHREALL